MYEWLPYYNYLESDPQCTNDTSHVGGGIGSQCKLNENTMHEKAGVCVWR